MYASIDMAFHKLENQIKRFKEKKVQGKRRERVKEKWALLTGKSDGSSPAATGQGMASEDAFNGRKIIRVKQHAMKPISPEEAVQEMEMVGHDFYVFKNSESNAVSVVYKRRNGQYGLIEPEL